MSIGACVGLKEALAANRLSGGNADQYPLNSYVGKNFFDDENYRAALERLDDGYAVSTDLIELMQDYLDGEREHARNLFSFAEKWTTRLKQQSSLVSYHTTKRAQLDVVRVAKEIANVKESTCNEIEKVIDKYRTYVDETYTSERFRPGRKHGRTNELKKLFKTAHASLQEVSGELDTVRSQEKKASETVRTAERACEILELDPTTTEKHLARANDNQAKKRAQLAEIQDRLLETKQRYKSAQKVYRNKATEVFKQCQYVEEGRLDQIRETLLDFIQAMHTQKQATDLAAIFAKLATKVTTQQNSFDDLLFWAKTYGIESKLAKSLTLTAIEDEDEENSTASRSAKKSTSHETERHEKHQSVVATEGNEEESSTTVPSKAKTRKTRTTEQKNANAIEPSTTNCRVLNHV